MRSCMLRLIRCINIVCMKSHLFQTDSAGYDVMLIQLFMCTYLKRGSYAVRLDYCLKSQ